MGQKIHETNDLINNPDIYVGKSTTSYYYFGEHKLKTQFKEYNKTYLIKGERISDLGKYTLSFYFHLTYGFVKLIYETPENKKVTLELSQTTINE